MLWKIKKFDWLMPETNFLQSDIHVCMCLHFAMRLVDSYSSGAPDCGVVEQVKTNANIEDTFYVLTQLFKPLVNMHVVTRPACAVCKLVVDLRTCALKRQIYVHPVSQFESQVIISRPIHNYGKSSEYFFNNKL